MLVLQESMPQKDGLVGSRISCEQAQRSVLAIFWEHTASPEARRQAIDTCAIVHLVLNDISTLVNGSPDSWRIVQGNRSTMAGDTNNPCQTE